MKELLSCVAEYREGGDSARLIELLSELVEEMLVYIKVEQDLVGETVEFCIEKIDKVDPTKTLTFGYFTTIIGCYIRSRRLRAKLRS